MTAVLSHELDVELDEPIPYTLTDLPPGRYLVDTVDETFDVDTVGRVAVRLDLASEAAGKCGEPEPFLFDTVECRVGEPMLFDAEGAPRATDVVLGVTRVRG
jgi:hypothetical protein